MVNDNIKCPNCGHEFPVEEALLRQAEGKIRQEFEEKNAEQTRIFKNLKDNLDKEKLEFEKTKENEEIFIKKCVADLLQEEKLKIIADAASQVEEKIKQLEQENENKRNENKELKKREVDLMARERELLDKQEIAEISMNKKFLEMQEEIESRARMREREQNELKIKDLQKRYDDQKELIEVMKRKSEQGSTQMQGEVQENALEELLKNEYPYDDIEPVSKGVKGPDVIQVVKNEYLQVCGRIIYESKRTKAFSEEWIQKLKDDQLNIGAELAIIVTSVLPKGMERFGRKDGIWICTYHETKNISFVLREILIREYAVRSSIQNMDGKMERMYSYLTSEEFKNRVERIVTAFRTIKDQIDKEKRAMQNHWKQREKHLEIVIDSTIGMFGTIRGIAGMDIEEIKQLELSDGSDIYLDEIG